MTQRMPPRSKILAWVRVQPEPVCAYAVYMHFGWAEERILRILRSACERSEIKRVFRDGSELFVKLPRVSEASSPAVGSRADLALCLLREKGAMTRGQIASELHIPSEAVSSIVATLKRFKLLGCEGDRRSQRYYCLKRGPEPAKLVNTVPKHKVVAMTEVDAETRRIPNSVFAFAGALS